MKKWENPILIHLALEKTDMCGLRTIYSWTCSAYPSEHYGDDDLQVEGGKRYCPNCKPQLVEVYYCSKPSSPSGS